MNYYDRYAQFRENGQVRFVPFLEIPKESSDLFIVFDKERMRLDTLSYKYYGNSDFAWLILQANPHVGGYEYAIRDGITIRIPYPLTDALNRYEISIRNIKSKRV